MPTSQCWCVDGESKFVLRVRDGVYYRLELPFDTDEDKARLDEFKGVLARVLRYEKTACPFKRGFHVEITEAADESPTRVRIQKPTSRAAAKKWKLRGVWVPEDVLQRRAEATPGDETPVSETSEESIEDDADSSNSAEDASKDESATDVTAQQATSSPKEEFEKRRQRFDSAAAEPPRPPFTLPIRSITAPIVMAPAGREISAKEPSAIEEPNPEADTSENGSHPAELQEESENDSSSISSSRASFYSTHTSDEAKPIASSQEYVEDALPTPRPDIPPPVVDVFPLPKSAHTRDVSEVTVTARSEAEGSTSIPSAPSTPPLIRDMDDVGDPPFSDAITPPNTLRLRRIPKSLVNPKPETTLTAPYTPSIFSPQSPSRGRQLTAALLQKAYSLILGPPANLVALMLRIAARIAGGANILYSFDLRDRSEKMAGTWDSDEEEEWDEDDFGVPLTNTKSNADSFVSAESSPSSSMERRRLDVD